MEISSIVLIVVKMVLELFLIRVVVVRWGTWLLLKLFANVLGLGPTHWAAGDSLLHKDLVRIVTTATFWLFNCRPLKIRDFLELPREVLVDIDISSNVAQTPTLALSANCVVLLQRILILLLR